MLLRIALFSLIAIGLASFGGIAWIGMHGPSASPAQAAEAPPAPTKTTVLVAAHTLRAGSLLKPEDVVPQEMLIAEVKPGARPDTPQARGEMFGAMVRRSLVQGEVILPGDMMRPGDHGFLAAVLGPGMRAVSVGVDAISGTAGLIWPGDNVDLILTMDDSGMSPGHRVSGETVLHSVRVIAIDQQLVQGGGSGQADYQSARTVTLEVTPAEAERVQVAVRLGKLSLAVVSADETTAVATNGATQPLGATLAGATVPQTQGSPVTWGGDVSAALRAGGNGDTRTVKVFQGASEGKEFHF